MRTLLFQTRSLALCALAASATLASGGDRDIQFKSVDILNSVVELHNFGHATISLEGWKFCSHNFTSQRRYSNGISGVSIAAGASLFVYYNDDAPADPNAINFGSIGGSYAVGFSSAAYAIEIFTPGPDGSLSFNSTTDMNDHLQWAHNLDSVGSASTRSGQAVASGLWALSTDFIETDTQTTKINLIDLSGAELHGSMDYETEPNPCQADTNGDGILDNGDIGTFVQLFLAGDLVADFNGDGILDNGDIGAFVTAFLTGC